MISVLTSFYLIARRSLLITIQVIYHIPETLYLSLLVLGTGIYSDFVGTWVNKNLQCSVLCVNIPKAKHDQFYHFGLLVCYFAFSMSKPYSVPLCAYLCAVTYFAHILMMKYIPIWCLSDIHVSILIDMNII